MVDVLVNSSWLGPLLWSALYISDNLLTVACARMYQAQDIVVFEGSYEITPLFQADVNALRRVSPRFWIALLASTGYLVVVQRIADATVVLEDLYAAVLGAMLLIQVTVHHRHLRNWFLFRNGAGVVRGRVVYPRGLLLRMSAFELALFAGLYLALFLATGSVFILGGVLACAVLSLNHYRLASHHQSVPKAA